MDFKNTNSVVIRVCETEDYCKNNPCVAFCDERKFFNNSIKWTPTDIAKQLSEFQRRFDVHILNDKKLTHKYFDRKRNKFIQQYSINNIIVI